MAKTKKEKITIISELNVQIISTAIVCLEKGIDIKVINTELPNYMVLVELNIIAANTFKDEETYYEYLDLVQEQINDSKYVGLENNVVKDMLEKDHPAIYNFMTSRNFLE